MPLPDAVEMAATFDGRSPATRYADALASGQFMPDEEQATAVYALDEVWQRLLLRFESSRKRGLGRFRQPPVPTGVYMWGGVGRGKTWLMDQFFDAIPFRRKMRLHFHHFMQRVHRELNDLKGQRDPLDQVADRIHRDAVVICFDEFFVSNVTDAMILGDLFGMLFQRGITLIATSNIEPDGLYKNGIHRDRFLPAIAVLKQHVRVLNVDAGVDYRLRVLKQADLYRSPLSDDAENWLARRFCALNQQHEISEEPIMVNGRVVNVRGHTEDVLWCDFDELCMRPRSAADFIDLAKTYNTILVGKVPVLDDNVNDPTRRLIYLVDEFYDRRVKLIVTAQQSILDLYSGEKLAFEIQRTRSRLLEMQSDEYLQAEHRLAD
ncbi:MAG: cell division protein ZapE [Pseudomonadota bacterium]|nr:cell division protein ZapE [Pseudomonadota bacterium]